MANDSASGPPQAGGGGGGPLGYPWWIWGVGVAGVIGFLWWRSRANANKGNAVLQNPTVSPVVDPSTGGILDPLTGLPYLTSQGSAASSTLTMPGWIAAAQAALKNAGYAPALVEQALYDFTNGNSLNNAEGGVINRALGLVGSPPNLLPFLGTVPNPPVAAHTPFLTPTDWSKLSKAAQKKWMPWVSTGGAHGYIPVQPYTPADPPKLAVPTPTSHATAA